MEISLTIEDENLNHKNDEYIHYQKINIIGEQGVGKSSFISYLKNYSNNDFIIERESQNNLTMKSFDDVPLLIEDIYRYKIDFNADRNLYFNIYETNLNNYEYIKKNLETLLFQTECVIIMWDKNNSGTFDNIPNLIKEIKSIFKKKNLHVPIFVFQNKMDLDESSSSVKSVIEKNLEEKIKEMKKQKNIIYKNTSLFDKDKFYELILKIFQEMETLERDTKKQGNNYLNFDVFDVKFKYPLQNLNEEYNSKVETENFINCILLGDKSSGKNSFINILLEKDYSDKPSKEDLYIFCSEINNGKYFLKINNIKEKDKSMEKNLYKKSDIFLLFFDVTNKESYEEIKKMLEGIVYEKGKNDNYEILLIGNKIDENKDRAIDGKTAKKFADEKNMRYIECSCLKKINIFEILNEIAIIAYRKSFNKKNDNISCETNKVIINNKNIKKNNSENNSENKRKNNRCC